MSAVQMNIRMDSALKASGNAVIAKLGYTPSQVVRALWEFATVQGALPPALTHLLRDNRDANTTRDSTPDRASEGAALVSSFYRQVGIEEPADSPIDYDELRQLAAAEQLEKWRLA